MVHSKLSGSFSSTEFVIIGKQGNGGPKILIKRKNHSNFCINCLDYTSFRHFRGSYLEKYNTLIEQRKMRFYQIEILHEAKPSSITFGIVL